MVYLASKFTDVLVTFGENCQHLCLSEESTLFLVCPPGLSSGFPNYCNSNVLPILLSGGYYFIEDMQVGRSRAYADGHTAISDVIQAWIEQLLISPRDSSDCKFHTVFVLFGCNIVTATFTARASLFGSLPLCFAHIFRSSRLGA